MSGSDKIPYFEVSRGIAERLCLLAEGMPGFVPEDDRTAMISSAFIEFLAHRLQGITPAVERLRILADLAECQARAEMSMRQAMENPDQPNDCPFWTPKKNPGDLN